MKNKTFKNTTLQLWREKMNWTYKDVEQNVGVNKCTFWRFLGREDISQQFELACIATILGYRPGDLKRLAELAETRVKQKKESR